MGERGLDISFLWRLRIRTLSVPRLRYAGFA